MIARALAAVLLALASTFALGCSTLTSAAAISTHGRIVSVADGCAVEYAELSAHRGHELQCVG